MFSCQVVIWVRSYIEPDLFDNNVPFNNTIPIYLIDLLWKLGHIESLIRASIRVRLRVALF